MQNDDEESSDEETLTSDMPDVCAKCNHKVQTKKNKDASEVPWDANNVSMGHMDKVINKYSCEDLDCTAEIERKLDEKECYEKMSNCHVVLMRNEKNKDHE